MSDVRWTAIGSLLFLAIGFAVVSIGFGTSSWELLGLGLGLEVVGVGLGILSLHEA